MNRNEQHYLTVFAAFGAMIADVAELAHREARQLRNVKGLSVKAGRRARLDQVCQTLLRAMEEAESLDFREVLFLLGADRSVNREDEAASLRVLSVMHLDDVPQDDREVYTLHGDSPDSRRSA